MALIIQKRALNIRRELWPHPTHPLRHATGFLFLFFSIFKLILFLISISVLINDFEILASSSSVKKSSVFGTTFGIISGGVG